MTTLAERIRSLSRIRSRAGFARHVAVLVGGATLSQVVSILTAPIITRLYAPDDVGVWALFVALTGILAVVANLRYELTIVLPEQDEEAISLLALSVLIAVLMAGGTLIMVSLLRYPLARLLGNTELTSWLWALPPTVFLMGLYQAGQYWSARKEQFTLLAVSRVSNAVITSGSQIGIALTAGAGPAGLIVGTVAGQALVAGILSTSVWRYRARFFRNLFSWRSILDNIYQRRGFPLYSMPYCLSGALGIRSLFLLLGIWDTTRTVGLLALAMKVVHMPVQLVGGALRNVFFQRASRQLQSGHLEPVVSRILTLLVIVVTPLLVFVIFDAQWLFGLVLGKEWTAAGTFASILAFPMFMHLLTTWLDRVYDILDRQRLALRLQVLNDVLSIGLFSTALVWLKSAEWAVGVYSGLTAIFLVIWLIITFRVAGFSLARLGRLGVAFVGVFCAAGGMHWVATALLRRAEIAATIYALSMTVYYVYVGYRYRREWMQILERKRI